jgi:hypothetical protein
MQKALKIAIIILIAVNFLYCVSGAVHFPLQSVDVYGYWLLKAKIFYVNGILPLTNLNLYPYSHPQHPILLPVLFSLIYSLMGRVNEMPVFLIYPVIYVLILLLAYRMFRKLGVNQTFSLIVTYIYSMLSPLLAMGGRKHAGEADIFITLIYWGIVHFVFNYLKDKKLKWLILTSILIMVASQVKTEGVLAAVIFLFIPIARNRKAIFLFISLIPAVIWNYIVIKTPLVRDFGWMLTSVPEIIKRTGEVFYYTVAEMINIRNWYIFWPVFWLSFFIPHKKSQLILKITTQTILAMGVLLLLNYLFSTFTPQEYVPGSMDRILIQLSPFLLGSFALRLSEFRWRDISGILGKWVT